MDVQNKASRDIGFRRLFIKNRDWLIVDDNGEKRKTKCMTAYISALDEPQFWRVIWYIPIAPEVNMEITPRIPSYIVGGVLADAILDGTTVVKVCKE